MNSKDIYSVYITASDNDEAKAIARVIVEARLAACANIFPSVNSIYWWNGKMEQSNEAVIIVKTTGSKLHDLEEKVKKIHSYDCPCFVAVRIDEGNKDYMKWVTDSVE